METMEEIMNGGHNGPGCGEQAQSDPHNLLGQEAAGGCGTALNNSDKKQKKDKKHKKWWKQWWK